jgi:RND family efflux transporter MFP subunit
VTRIHIVVLAVLILTSCSREPKQVQATSKAAEPLEIRVAKAETRTVDRFLPVTGSLYPDDTVSISSEVAGRVASIRVDFGQNVRKGDVIVELDAQEYRIQLERSRASFAQALARLGLSPNEEIKPPDTTPAVRQALAQADDARSKFEAAAKLVKTGDIPLSRYNELEKTYRARQAAVEEARDELRTQWMSMEALRAEVKLAEKRVADCTLRAPFDGAVAERLASPGQYIKENTPVLKLVKAYPLRLRVEVPENAVAAVRAGTPLTFTTDAVANAEFRAVVREVNPSLDEKSRSLIAEARMATPDQRLRPGMFVQVRLRTQAAAEIVVVPKSAVYSVAGLTKVFVIRENKAVECRIPPAEEIGGWIEVPRNVIRPGENIAIERIGMLIDGAPVRMRG